jgi:hypothetical protein
LQISRDSTLYDYVTRVGDFWHNDWYTPVAEAPQYRWDRPALRKTVDEGAGAADLIDQLEELASDVGRKSRMEEAAGEGDVEGLRGQLQDLAHTARCAQSRQEAAMRRNILDEPMERPLLLRQTARLSLQNARQLRTHADAPTHTALQPSSVPVAEAMAAKGRRYYEAHQMKRGGPAELPAELRGTPHHLRWRVPIQTLMESEIQEVDKQALREHACRRQGEPTLIEENAHACRLARAHLLGWSKLFVGTAEPLRVMMGAAVRGLRSLGAKWKLGVAPWGPAEREAERLFTRLGD